MPMEARNSKPLYPADTRQRIKHDSIKKKEKKELLFLETEIVMRSFFF